MDLRIKVVSSSININTTENKNSNNYKIKPEVKKSKLEIKLGSNVKYKDDNIIGKITFIDDTKIIVTWNDESKQRIKLSDIESELEYVDDIETIVSPMTTQRHTPENKTANIAIDKALNSLSEDIIDDDMIESNIRQPEEADIEKIKLQRQVNELQDKLNNKSNNKMKDKIAADLVDLAIAKGMVEKDDLEFEIQVILSMDDNQIEEYKTKVLSFQNDGEVTSTFEAVEDKNLSEAQKALNKIKGNGGKGIIGDFSKMNNNSPVETYTESYSTNSSDEKRTLAELRDSKVTFANQKPILSFEDQFVDILSSRVDQNTVSNPFQEKVANRSLPGFENLQGLTKPLVVNKPMMQNPTNTGLKELFSSLDWTTLGSRK
jgi:hypothetical protein